jgi:hypothetical protein
VYVDITDGDCGCSISFWSEFCVTVNGYLVIIIMLYTVVLYHNDYCSFVYNAEVLGVYVRGCCAPLILTLGSG